MELPVVIQTKITPKIGVIPYGVPIGNYLARFLSEVQKAYSSGVGVRSSPGASPDALLFAPASAVAQESLPTCSIPATTSLKLKH
ncbi:MAG TPA: hypothetical protein VFD16_00365 [Candidatus Saccharimonadales bacterium]|nr:hypothetical protein [Candidatus Saccharimonadales bacterium]